MTRTLGDSVATAMRDSILNRVFQPGTRLIDTNLAEQLGVSRATVREALRQLTHEGLVSSVPYRGYFVAEFSAEDILELLELRAMLEGRAAEAAVAHLSESDFHCLQRLADEIESSDYQSDVTGVRDIDIAFHQVIARHCNKPILYELWSTLNSRMNMLDTLCRDILCLNSHESAARHRHYIEELRSADPLRARLAGEGHYQFHAQRFRAILEKGEGGTPSVLTRRAGVMSTPARSMRP